MEKKTIEKLINLLGDAFDENQKRDFQYVVAYHYTKDDNLMGYHADSFGSLTQDKLSAKRYAGEDPFRQLRIIRDNLDFVLTYAPDSLNPFAGIVLGVQEKFYSGLTGKDIYITAEYLDEGIPPQRFVATIIEPENINNEN